METSYVNKITGFVIALVLGAILVGGVLAPTVAGIQDDITTLKYANSTTLLKMAESEEEITITYADSVLKINDVVQTPSTNSTVFASDVFSADQFQYNGNWLTRAWYPGVTELKYPSAFELTFNNGEVTGSYTIGGTTTTVEGPYAYLMYASDNGKYAQVASAAPGTSGYIKSDADVILNGLYYTGENDTVYSYVDGVAQTAEEYTITVNIDKEKVNGTTDIYKISTVTVDIGGESFTPFRYFIPIEVTGHEANNQYSIMFGVITLLAIVMLVVFAANAVKGKYN